VVSGTSCGVDTKLWRWVCERVVGSGCSPETANLAHQRCIMTCPFVSFNSLREERKTKRTIGDTQLEINFPPGQHHGGNRQTIHLYSDWLSMMIHIIAGDSLTSFGRKGV
jgi:hypothetical protein